MEAVDELGEGDVRAWLGTLDQSQVDRWLRQVALELLHTVEFSGRLEFGALLPATHPFRAGCAGLRDWLLGEAPSLPVALGHGFGAQGNLAELTRLCSLFTRMSVQIGHSDVNGTVDRLNALCKRLTDVEVTGIMRASLDLVPAPSPADLDTALPDAQAWLGDLSARIGGLSAIERLECATRLEDGISKYVRDPKIFLELAGPGYPGTKQPRAMGRRWPTDTLPSFDWAGAALARVQDAAASAVAPRGDSETGLIKTFGLVDEAVWAGQLAGQFAFPGSADADALAVARNGLRRFRARALDTLDVQAFLPVPKAMTAAPSDDIYGLLYAAVPSEAAEFFTSVITELADLIDPQEWYVTKQALKAVSRFSEPLDLELLQTLSRIRLSEPERSLLGYAAGMAWRSIVRSREVLPRRSIPSAGHPADWERSYAAEADRAEALRALALVAPSADWLTQRWPRPLATDETVCGPAGSAGIQAMAGRPRAMWVTDTGCALPAQIVVNDRGLVVAADGISALFDPATGAQRGKLHASFGGISGRAVRVGDLGRDLITGAELPSPPSVKALQEPVYRTHDGLIVQETTIAQGITYDAVGTFIRACDDEGAQVWEVSVGELIGHLRPRLDTYPEDPGDHGYGVAAMTPANGCLYVLTTGKLLLRLEADPEGSLYPPLDVRRPVSDPLPPEVTDVTGWRYATRVSFGQEKALLCGSEPFTAQRVYEALTRRGYQVSRVTGEERWVAGVENPDQERYRVHASRDSSAKWYSLIGPRWVTLDAAHRRWFYWSRREDMFYDDDRFIYVSDEMARLIALCQGAELLDDEANGLVYQHAWARGQRPRHEPAGLEGRLSALEEQAASLTEIEPHREVVRRGYAPEPQRVAQLPAVAAAFNESFPLVRLNYGFFESPVLLVNKLAIDGVAYSIYVQLWTSSLEYQAVTPFCPEEGYRIDGDDLDPARRRAKVGTRSNFPVSPWRLWTYVDHDADPGSPAAAVAESLWLELTFPGDQAFRSASYRRGRWGMVYDEWVQEPYGLLPVVPGLAPEWVSIQLPKLPELLKTVTARLRYLPDQPRPADTSFFEAHRP
ncbi:hypothetical protein [Catelliglobosispora koreensis]|uniref:hypothetical protein n=1 Tax=Catelliglobosispora koreensis TaxID=129052 RepID=UPI00035DFCDB|nr:hypothetical protein [Catelliglobosispora koreensis]